MSSPNDRLDRYYDRLARYGGLARWIGRDGGFGEATVHRRLRPERPGERPEQVVHRLIADAIGAKPGLRLLDAGCGLGGTSLYFARHFDATCLGISLSPAQVRTASANAAKAGLGGRCAFRVASYDAPLPEASFDAIVAIESLAHSPDLGASIANLARALAPGGRLIAVDDVREAGAADGDARRFVEHWRVPGFVPRAAWREAFDRAGLRIVSQSDLTARIPPRNAAARGALAALNRAGRALAPAAGVRAVLDSHWGGLALERLYARGGASYLLFAAV